MQEKQMIFHSEKERKLYENKKKREDAEKRI